MNSQKLNFRFTEFSEVRHGPGPDALGSPQLPSMAAIEAPAEKQGEYDSSRYAPCDAPVTPGRYRRLNEQEQEVDGMNEASVGGEPRSEGGRRR